MKQVGTFVQQQRLTCDIMSTATNLQQFVLECLQKITVVTRLCGTAALQPPTLPAPAPIRYNPVPVSPHLHAHADARDPKVLVRTQFRNVKGTGVCLNGDLRPGRNAKPALQLAEQRLEQW